MKVWVEGAQAFVLDPAPDREVVEALQAGVLQAEALGIAATGIGCFFDDRMHAMLGLQGRALQSLYHFTVGGRVDDERLQTRDAYFHLEGAATAPTP